jgi:hypothetical protein
VLQIELWEDSDKEAEGDAQPQQGPGADGAQQAADKAGASSIMRERSVNTLPLGAPTPAAAAGPGEPKAPASSSKPVRTIWSFSTPQKQQQQERLQSDSASYKLTAIIRHLGFSVNSGHYKADVLCSPEVGVSNSRGCGMETSCLGRSGEAGRLRRLAAGTPYDPCVLSLGPRPLSNMLWTDPVLRCGFVATGPVVQLQ